MGRLASRASFAALLGASVFAAARPAAGQVQFVDESAARGILPYVVEPGFGGGVSAEDYDGDGDIDLFLPQAQGSPDRLYRNAGNGTFVDVGAAAGVGSFASGRQALWLDYDDDRMLDLLVASDCYLRAPACFSSVTIRLFRQSQPGVFTNVTSAAGFTSDLVTEQGQHRSALSAGDIDRDGDLDVMMGLWQGAGPQLFRNDGGFFTDVTLAAGLGGGEGLDYPWQAVFHDFDGDGWVDIFAAVDYLANHLWMNQHDGTFIDAAVEAGVDITWNDMGIAPSDYDNDGDIDLYVTHIFEFGMHNVLLRNDTSGGAVLFTDVSEAAGVDDTGFGWGTSFMDADNDGWLDIAVTNGYFNGIGFDDPSRFFLSNGGAGGPVTFTDVSGPVAFDDTQWGSTLLSADIDRDGDLDLIQTCNTPGGGPAGPFRVLENERSGAALANHSLVVRPRQSGKNHWAIGAVVRATAGGSTSARLITAGVSHLGQEPAEAFFGLGSLSSADVEVTWPSGAHSTYANVAADQVFVACDADLDGEGTIGFGDLTTLLIGWGPCGALSCPGDLDGNGDVGFNDLVLLLLTWGECE